MKQVWKCDHCSHTDIDSDKMAKHEPECSFNKATKHCYTCKYHYGRDYTEVNLTGCEIEADVYIGEYEGNCPHWVYEYLDKEREEKINDLGI